MMKMVTRKVVFMSFLAMMAGRAEADFLTIGTLGGPSNAYPFTTYAGEYQQFYAASSFGSPVTITGISFSTATGFAGLQQSATFTLALSTTTASLASPSSNYAANKGADFRNVFSGTVTFTPAGNNTFDLIIPTSAFRTYPSRRDVEPPGA